MKYAKLALALFVASLVAGCASAPPPTTSTTSSPGAAPQASAPPQGSAPPSIAPPKNDTWPKIYTDETYLTSFDSSWSEAEAIGAIKNLQNSFVEFNAGIPLSELDVDSYGLRAKWQWVENNSFIKSASFIIPFDQVTSILLEYYPALNKDYKWGLIVNLSGSSAVSVRTPSRDTAERLGKAILVLAKARSAKLSIPNLRFGAALSALSDAQAQAAGILKTSGVIVLWVFRESPAEKAGFSPQDIITGVGGKPVHSTEELFAAIDAAADAGAKELKIDGIRRSYRIEDKKYVEIFVPLTYTLAIDQAGGTK
ncbi:MAG: hypothetical protein SAMD01599839_16850 [Rectinema sp.]